MKFLFPVLAIIFFSSCTNDDNNGQNTVTVASNVKALGYTVTNVYPHDTSSFTQGLMFHKGQLLESTGNYGSSKLLAVDLKTGQHRKRIDIPGKYFAEGLAVIKDTLYQLTWKEGVVFVYTPDLKKIKELSLSTAGWGLASDGQQLIVSDGSNNLYFYEPSNFRLLRTQGVTEDGSPAVNLNELEYINGYIYANQWQYNYILKIDPQSGQVVGKMDLTELSNRARTKNPSADFLNGIAYDSTTNKVYVTGKYWPELYEISFSF